MEYLGLDLEKWLVNFCMKYLFLMTTYRNREKCNIRLILLIYTLKFVKFGLDLGSTLELGQA